MKYAGADWIRESLEIKDISDLGERVADILGQVYRGIYHLPSKQLRKMEWNNPDFIEFIHYGELATYDFSALTELVILCHDEAIRLSINACSPKYLRICFHKRIRGADHMSQRHPTIEQAIQSCRAIRDEK